MRNLAGFVSIVFLVALVSATMPFPASLIGYGAIWIAADTLGKKPEESE